MMEKNLFPPNIQIKLEAFEGPFDLLFHLIEKNRISLYDIPIGELADQYMSVINSYPGDMDLISGFIVVAATLLEIKSQMLLPQTQNETPDEDPREFLVERLLEYKRFKQAAETLKAYEAEGVKRVFRGPDTELLKKLSITQTVSADEILKDIGLARLRQVFTETMLRRELRTDKVRASFNAITKETYTVEEKIGYLLALLADAPRVGLLRLLYVCRSKMEKITTFLAMLELIKSKSVTFSQDDIFEDILLERADA